MLPRGADAVVMVENTDQDDANGTSRLEIKRPVTPGENVSYAGTDIARGETVLRAGQPLTSREIGVLAAIGARDIAVYRKPRVAIFSTGNEIVAPGNPLRTGSRLRFERRDHRRRSRRAGRDAGSSRRDPRRRSGARGGARQRPRVRCRRVLRRHLEGRGRPVLSRRARRCATPASSRTALRSSRASRSASPSRTASRSSSCPAFRRRRSSRSTNSWRRCCARSPACRRSGSKASPPRCRCA